MKTICGIIFDIFFPGLPGAGSKNNPRLPLIIVVQDFGKNISIHENNLSNCFEYFLLDVFEVR